MSDFGSENGGGGSELGEEPVSEEEIIDEEMDLDPVVIQPSDVVEQDALSKAIPKDQRLTTPYLTKYEKARILGTRALQISMNAPVMVDLDGESDPLEIALKELRLRKIPLVIRRYIHDGSYEDWDCSELI